MKKGLLIVGLLLCGMWCAPAGAQSLDALKNRLGSAEPSYGSRIEIVEHDAAASAVRSMRQGGASSEKIRGYRVRIFFDNGQHARSQAESAISRFKDIYPDIPAYMDYDNMPYFKVTVGNCLTSEEAIILWGKIKDAFDRAFIVREDIPLSLFGEQPASLPAGGSAQEGAVR